MLERLAQIARTDSSHLADRLQKPAETRTVTPPAATAHTTGSGKSPVREAIAMLLHQPDLAQKIEPPAVTEPESMPGVTLLLELLELLRRQPGLNTGAVLEHWRGREEARYLHKLAQWTPLTEKLDLAAEIRGHLSQIEHQAAEKRIGVLLHEERLRTLNDKEKQELKELLQSRPSDARR